MEDVITKKATSREQLSMFPDWFQPAVDPHDLNLRQRVFVLHYVGEAKGNGAEAARLAGYAKNSARITASKLLSNPNIQKAISDRREKLVDTIKEDQLATLKALQAHLHSDIRKIYRDDGTLKNINELDDATAAAVESVEVKEGEKLVEANGTVITIPASTVKVKLTSKASARSDLLKVQGLLKDTIDLNAKGAGIIYYPEKVAEGAPVEDAGGA